MKYADGCEYGLTPDGVRSTIVAAARYGRQAHPPRFVIRRSGRLPVSRWWCRDGAGHGLSALVHDPGDDSRVSCPGAAALSPAGALRRCGTVLRRIVARDCCRAADPHGIGDVLPAEPTAGLDPAQRPGRRTGRVTGRSGRPESPCPWQEQVAEIGFPCSSRAMVLPPSPEEDLADHHPVEIPCATWTDRSWTGDRTTAALLMRLARAQMIAETTPGRFHTHDLLRVYARELGEALDDEADRQTSVCRLFDYYLHSADRADRVLNTHRYRMPLDGVPSPGPQIDDARDALKWLNDERRNMVAVWGDIAAAESSPSEAIEAYETVIELLPRRRLDRSRGRSLRAAAPCPASRTARGWRTRLGPPGIRVRRGRPQGSAAVWAASPCSSNSRRRCVEQIARWLGVAVASHELARADQEPAPRTRGGGRATAHRDHLPDRFTPGRG